MVMIGSFYGGGNYFSTQIQILAEAGIYVLSPSPRGSDGFGREFSSLNDKDLVGNEIIDIIHFYEHCNIPDRITLEAGDPDTDTEKLQDRSPLFHADKATGKLLLTHGTNDSRVPIEGSRQMAETLRNTIKNISWLSMKVGDTESRDWRTRKTGIKSGLNFWKGSSK